MNLKQENTELKKKLEIAQSWMKREIQNQILAVSKKHLLEQSGNTSTQLLTNEMEDIITQKILSFFSDIPLTNIPEDMIENLTKSEIQYYLLSRGNNIDPLSITIGYQKILESLIEDFVIYSFRSYGKERTYSPESPLDEALQRVLEKGYSLSIGRIFHLLSNISEKKSLSPYEKLFYTYLEKYSFLKNTLLKDSFLLQLRLVTESEVFSTKRHSGTVSREEVEEIRRLCIGDFSDTDCLVYQLFQTQTTF